ncbi:hypothetical protein DOS84_18175 [Flavobacterium aquariorum]|uniref:Uncharacterized protein n=1 Tax=Flavobacterium aquariorum TaxID=2217670 RepID=A0A2W7TNZ9_9FLAO|nr:hypothetical protein DOS84_18175 [Flavobacterium aquariorum]
MIYDADKAIRYFKIKKNVIAPYPESHCILKEPIVNTINLIFFIFTTKIGISQFWFNKYKALEFKRKIVL